MNSNLTSSDSMSMTHVAYILLILAIAIHGAMLYSLFSEPLELNHPEHLNGTSSHPQELEAYQGFLDRFFHDADRVPRGLDFFSIYQAGHNFGHGMSVYYGVREHRYGSGALVVPYFSGFRYLPLYACTYGWILTVLPPWSSYWVWIVCVEVLLLLNLLMIIRIPCPIQFKLFAAVMWLAYSPYYVELHIGQQSMVTVTLLHIAGIAQIRKKTRIRDASYIASVLWKLNTLLILPLWLKYKRFKTMLILFSLIVLTSIPYFLLHPGSFQEFSSYFHHKFIATGPNSLGLWALLSTIWQRLELSNDLLRPTLQIFTLLILIMSSLVTLLPRKISFVHGLSLWICLGVG